MLAPDPFSTNPTPLQTCVVLEDAATVGIGYTVSNAEAVLLLAHPAVLVPETEYVVFAEGDTVITLVVASVLHV